MPRKGPDQNLSGGGARSGTGGRKTGEMRHFGDGTVYATEARSQFGLGEEGRDVGTLEKWREHSSVCRAETMFGRATVTT